MKKRIILLLTAMVLAFSFAGCGKSDSDSKQEVVDPNSIVGSWDGNGCKYEFNADGTGSYDCYGSIMDIKWSTEGDRLSVLFLMEGANENTAPAKVKYLLENGVLTIYDSMGNPMTYTRL